MVNFEKLLKIMIEKDASDLHLKVNCPPMLRVRGNLEAAADVPKLSAEDLNAIAKTLMSVKQAEMFGKSAEIDFAYSVPDLGRFRTNIFMQRGTIGIILRLVKTNVPTFKELHLPQTLEKIAGARSGIVVVCGPTGCGKSSTLASIVDYINSNERVHIMSVEDPIEYLHSDKTGIVNQREIGIDTDSFRHALRYIMRQDPDVILIGEMRDADSMMAAMTAAEIGHLVLTTLHSINASQSVSRILDFFTADMRDLIRIQLSNVLHSVVCQRLVPTADGNGVVPVVEIMVCTGLIKKLISENKLDKLPAAIELGKEFGMQSLNQALLDLVNKGVITKDDALNHSLNPETLKLNMQGIFLDDSRRILDA